MCKCNFDIRIKKMNFFRTRKCKRNAVKDGYCKTHYDILFPSPEIIKKTELKIQQKDDKRRNIYLRKFFIKTDDNTK